MAKLQPKSSQNEHNRSPGIKFIKTIFGHAMENKSQNILNKRDEKVRFDFINRARYSSSSGSAPSGSGSSSSLVFGLIFRRTPFIITHSFCRCCRAVSMEMRIRSRAWGRDRPASRQSARAVAESRGTPCRAWTWPLQTPGGPISESISVQLAARGGRLLAAVIEIVGADCTVCRATVRFIEN